MVCDESIAGVRKDEGKTRIKGRNNRRNLKKPLIVEDEGVEYIGITMNEETDKPLARMMKLDGEDSPAGEPEKKQPIGEPEPVKPEIVAEGFRTDAADDVNAANRGLIYEVAEELYIKERTAAELEALAKPPFHRTYDEFRERSLDAEALRQTKRLISMAGDNMPSPTFLPEATYEQNDRPLGTAQAFTAVLLMLIPGVNIVTAIIFAVIPGTNRNLRSLSRAFLILAGIAFGAAALFLAGRSL